MKRPKLFIGMETSNLQDFVSRCCGAPLSLEPLIRIACGVCGKTEERPIYKPCSQSNNPGSEKGMQ